jgi:hypothetical protein
MTKDKDFQNSVYCLDCAYTDLGYNGEMLCIPKTKSCKPIYPYDWMIQSRIRKFAILSDKPTLKDDCEESKHMSIKLARKD